MIMAFSGYLSLYVGSIILLRLNKFNGQGEDPDVVPLPGNVTNELAALNPQFYQKAVARIRHDSLQ